MDTEFEALEQLPAVRRRWRRAPRCCCVMSASWQDRDGAKTTLLSTYLSKQIRFVFADQGFAGRLLDWAAVTLRTAVRIVRRAAEQRGFAVHPKRWVVERSLAWLTAHRRLARDYDPATRQFLTIDPAVDSTLQPYAYVNNNPLGASGTSGLCWGCSFLKKAWNGVEANAGAFAWGVADGLTFGAASWIGGHFDPGLKCRLKKDGWYIGGQITGMVAMAVPTEGLSAEAEGVAKAAEAAEGAEAAAAETSVVRGAEEEASSAHCSFDPNTPVLMADGSNKAIKDIRVGDQVVSGDPATGHSSDRAVTQLHDNLDTALADVTVEDAHGVTQVIRTTQNHRFFDATTRQWTRSDQLRAGDYLRSTTKRTSCTSFQ